MIYRDQLEAVYKLIEKPENWTQGDYAKNDEGIPVPISGEAACKWCLEGAALRLELGLGDFSRALGLSNAVAFNDTHTHAEVIELLRSAIEHAPVRP